jgi:translation initiation factor 5B
MKIGIVESIELNSKPV